MNSVPLLQVTFPLDNCNSYTMHYPLSSLTSYKIVREDVPRAKNIPGIIRHGVYVLFGNNTIYIGQTRNGIHRIEDHVRTKSFWEYAILFLADPDDFTLNIISGLEKSMIEDAIKNSPYKVFNSAVPQYKSPTDYEKSIIDSIYEDIKFIMHFHNIETTKEAHMEKPQTSVITTKKTYKAYKDSFTFSKLNIPIGAELSFADDPSIKAFVADDTHVRYNDEITSINALSKKLKNVNYAVTGRLCWKYNEKTLDELKKSMIN